MSTPSPLAELRARLPELTLRDEHRLRQPARRCPQGAGPRARGAPDRGRRRGRRAARAAAPREPPEDHLSRRAARQSAQGRHRRRDPGPPGRDRRGGDRLRQDHAAAQDLPRTRARRPRADRAHPAAPPRRAHRGRAHRRRAGHRTRRHRRLQGAVHRHQRRRHPRQADDRRHPAGRDPGRPDAAPLRHDHHRRGPRAQPQHRLPARLPQAAPAAPPGPQGDHHLRDDRPRAVRRALRRRADRRGVGPHLSGRGPLPPARRPGTARSRGA